jgi:hypothetical protein
MSAQAELDRLIAKLPRKRLEPQALLAEVGHQLQIEWPADYVRLIADHNGVEGDVGEFLLQLTAVEDLIDYNSPEAMEYFPGLVMIGGDGGGEGLAFDRATGEVILAPLIGGEEDWLVLGANLVEALQRLERGEAFNAPQRGE